MITLFEESIAAKLGLCGQNLPLMLPLYSENQNKENGRRLSFTFKGSSAEFYIKNVHRVKSLNFPQQTFIREQFVHLLSLAMTSYTNAKPLILLDLDNSYLEIAKNIVEEGTCMPIALETRLVWVAYRSLNHKVIRQPYVLHIGDFRWSNMASVT